MLEFFHYISVLLISVLLREKASLNVKVIKYARFLHPEKRNKPGATNAISNLALKVAQVLENKLQMVFKFETLRS